MCTKSIQLFELIECVFMEIWSHIDRSSEYHEMQKPFKLYSSSQSKPKSNIRKKIIIVDEMQSSEYPKNKKIHAISSRRTDIFSIIYLFYSIFLVLGVYFKTKSNKHRLIKIKWNHIKWHSFHMTLIETRTISIQNGNNKWRYWIN